MAASSHPDNFERSDADPRLIAALALGLALFLATTPFLLTMLYPAATRPTRAESRLPPELRLQVRPRDDLMQLRAREDAALNGYGWIDRSHGITQIPIEQGMRLLAERGLPDGRPGAPSASNAQ
jgi:hypothetical protein